MPVEQLNSIVGIPVAGYHHLTAVKLNGRCRGPFLIERGYALECVVDWIVELGAPALANAHLFLVAAAHQHLP